MCVCYSLCVCMCGCMGAHTHLFVFVCVFVCVCVHACVCVCVCVCRIISAEWLIFSTDIFLRFISLICFIWYCIIVIVSFEQIVLLINFFLGGGGDIASVSYSHSWLWTEHITIHGWAVRTHCWYFFRILGNRVSELEKKLKTLEVAGLWSVSGIHLLLICISHLIYLVQSHSCAASLSER